MSTDAGAPRPSRARLALSGLAAVGLSLGLLELLAGLFDSVPSVIDAVGEMFIPYTPPAVKDWAIETFGTTDKAVLQASVAAVTLGVGAWAGVTLRRSWESSMTIFGAFTLVGAVALLMQVGVNAPLAILVLGLSAGAGILALRRLATAAGVAFPAGAQQQDSAASDVPVQRRSSHPDARPLSELDRRRFLITAGSVVVAGAAAGVGGRALGRQVSVDIDDVALGQAIDPAAPVRAANELQVPGLGPILVPNDEFYKIDVELGVPQISSSSWELKIHGMVDNEVVIDYEELTSRPMIERYVTIACVSNEVGDDLVGNAKWLGVPLADLLNEAGVRDGADQLVGRAFGGWTAGFPTELAFDGRDAMVAVGMNDEPLPVDHGFPARLIVPGLYGYVSATKWLKDIELTTWDGFDAYWVPRGWSKEGPIKTQSRIDVPRPGRTRDAGMIDVAGVAWAPTRGIQMVEVQVDDRDWIEATLSEPLSDDAWVQWSTRVELDPGEHHIRVRATDGTGETQTDEIQPPRPDGATGWHTIRVPVVEGAA